MVEVVAGIMIAADVEETAEADTVGEEVAVDQKSVVIISVACAVAVARVGLLMGIREVGVPDLVLGPDPGRVAAAPAPDLILAELCTHSDDSQVSLHIHDFVASPQLGIATPDSIWFFHLVGT